MSSPNLLESVTPCSGRYSFRQDLRLNAWLLVATLVYLAQLYTAHVFSEWSPLARGLLALTPLLPGLLYLRDWVRFIQAMDELQRRIQLGAHLFAAWGTLLIGIVLSTLNQHGAIDLLPHGLDLGGVMVLILPLWSIGSVIANRRYR